MSTPDSNSVIFFDLEATLVQRTAQGWSTSPSAAALLDVPVETRLGILCNLSPGRDRRDLRDLLRTVWLEERFDPTLLVVASALGVSLPDRRAFLVAAALADVPIRHCLFVSANLTRLMAATQAGMKTFQVVVATSSDARLLNTAGGAASQLGPTLLSAGLHAEANASAGPILLAGEVDEDTGPTFLLKGRVVTMDRSAAAAGVIKNGWIAIRRGKIDDISGTENASVPAAFQNVSTVDTHGTIYPGLMDLHNHLAYDVLPLWVVPQKYSNRSQWPRHKDYAPQIQLPINLLGSYDPTARSIVRYIEAKAIIGGSTTGQGVRSKQAGMTKLYRGAMRNIEQTDDERLVEAGSRVLDYKPGIPSETTSFKKALETYTAYFYHLSEGVDDTAHRHFTDLATAQLIAPALVGIHSLGLTAGNLRTLAQRGAKVIWSPYSNLLLYGSTLQIEALRDSEVLFSLGCDWSPTGSKNLLQELKVARYISKQQGNIFSGEDLARAVTVNAAKILGWDDYLGTLAKGKFADLLVLDGNDKDPYDQLIEAVERDVQLVCVHGVPRYGDAQMMTKLQTDAAHPLESITIGGKAKALYLYSASSPLNDLTLADATSALKDAMADLPAFQQEIEQHHHNLLAFGLDGNDSFSLELDNEYDSVLETPTAATAEAGATGPTLLAGAAPTVAQSIELDPLEVNNDAYWTRVDAQPNIGDLAGVLKNAYQ